MNGFQLPPALVEQLGWVLVHSVWQLALIGLVTLVLMRAMRRASARARYAMLLVALAAMTLSPLAALLALPRPQPAAVVGELLVDRQIQSGPLTVEVGQSIVFPGTAPAVAPARLARPVPASASFRDLLAAARLKVERALAPRLDWIVGLWCLGVCLFALRPAIGLREIGRLRRQGVSPVADNVAVLLADLARRMGLARPVAILESARVAVPVVVGHLRPLILLPVSLASQMPVAQLEAILAHELAHVRRHDYLVNLWQTLVETVLFYHPAVWWLSRRLRQERENCCDDLAVAVVQNRVEYGRALLAVAQLQAQPAALALGVGGGSLMARLARLFPVERGEQLIGAGNFVALGLLVASLVSVAIWASAMAKEPKELEKPDAAQKPVAIEFYVGEDKAGPGLKETKIEGKDDNLIYLPEKPLLKREDVAAVSIGSDSGGNAAVNITFTDAGAARMGQASGENIGKRMAVVVDGQVVFAATIRSKISDRAQITIGTKATAERLVQAISPTRPISPAEEKENDAKETEAAEPANAKPERNETKGEPNAAERVLHFPADRSMGIISVRESTEKGYRYVAFKEWREVGQARGEVRVPAGKEVKLAVGKAASNDLSGLDQLVPDDLQFLDAGQTDVDDKGLAHVARLTGLVHLDLSSCPITDEGFRQLAGLKQLRFVNLDAFSVHKKGFGVGDASLALLGGMPELETIRLRDCGKVTAAGMAALAPLKSLGNLGLEGTAIGDAGLVHLKQLPALDWLSLGVYEEGAGITDEGLKSIGEMTQLTMLHLSGNKISDAGLVHLALLTRLENISLDNTDVTEAGFAHLEPLVALRSLRFYTRRGDGVTDVGAAHLARLKELRQLSAHLRLTGTGIAALGSLPHLEQLDINDSKITPAEARIIGGMKALKWLHFQGCPLGDEELALMSDLPNVNWLQLARTHVSGDGMASLARMPSLEILQVDFGNREGQPPGLKPHLREIVKLKQVTKLRIAGFGFDSADLEILPRMSQLEELQINWPVDDEGARHIAGLRHLKRLELDDSVLTDRGLRQLGNLRTLTFLNMRGHFTDEGLQALARLKHLWGLQVESPYVTEKGMKALEAKLPELQYANLWHAQEPEEKIVASDKDSIRRWGDPEERAAKDALEDQPPPALHLADWANTDPAGLDWEKLRGSVVLVDFWGTWCGPCRALTPTLQSLDDKYRTQGLVILGIHTTNQAEKMPEYLAEKKIGWPQAVDVDEATAKAWKVSSWPTLYLIDRWGKLRMAGIYRDDAEAAVEELLSEKQPPGDEQTAAPTRATATLPNQNSVATADPDPLGKLEQLWNAQRARITSAAIDYRTFSASNGKGPDGKDDLKPLSVDEVEGLFAQVDLAAHPDRLGDVVAELMKEPPKAGALPPLMHFHQVGNRRAVQSDQGARFAGPELAIRFDALAKQADVYTDWASADHLESLADFRSLPGRSDRYRFVGKSEGLVHLKIMDQEDFFFSEATGILSRMLVQNTKYPITSLRMESGRVENHAGIVFPSLVVLANFLGLQWNLWVNISRCGGVERPTPRLFLCVHADQGAHCRPWTPASLSLCSQRAVGL